MKIIENKKLILKKYDDQIYQNPDDVLCDHKSPWVMLISGARGCGKSSLIINLIRNKEFYYRKYHNLFLLSATAFHDKKFTDNIDIDMVYTFPDSDWNEDIVEEYMNIAKEEARKEPSKYSLLIVDDFAAVIDKSPAFKHWVLNSRHYKTSVIVTSQKFSLFGTWLRENANMYVIFKPVSSREKEFVIDAIVSPHLEKEECKELSRICWKNTRDFLYINNRHPVEKMFHRCFDRINLELD